MHTGVAAALTVTALLGPVPGRAATPRHDVFLWGFQSGYVDVTFPSRFRPHVGAYDDPVRPRAATVGRYTGVWVESLSRRGTGPGGLTTTKSGGYWHMQFGEPDGGSWLPAGRYRVHLMTEPDSLSYFQFPVDGLARQTVLTPRYDETVHTNLVKPENGLPGGRLTDSLRTSAGTLAIAVGLVRADESMAQLHLCIAASTQLPCEVDPHARSSGIAVDLGPPHEVGTIVGVVAMPRMLPDGPHDVAFTAVVPESTQIELFTFTLN
jgi:hypothetical protein